MSLSVSSPDRKQVEAHLRFARAYAAEKLPWFAPALFRSRIVITEDVSVAAIDLDYRVYWNPDVVLDIWAGNPTEGALSELGFLWVHEISHRLRQHAERAEELRNSGRDVDDYLWNLACDFEINDADWTGLRMPAAYPGMLPEQIESAAGGLAENYLQRLLDRGLGGLPRQLDEGSGVHGQKRDWETDPDRPLTDLDQEMMRREVARRMQAAGVKPGAGWRDWSEATLRSRVNWRKKLRHRMSISLQRGIGSRIDYSFLRPSRRQSVYHPILAPSLRGDRTARIAVVVDTSGSMKPEYLQRVLTEVAAILRQFQYPVTLIPTDERAYEPVSVVAAREAMELRQLPGGGGTDLRTGIAVATQLKPAPDTILVLTDGFTPYPRERPARTVLFGIIGPPGARVHLPPNPPWSKDSVIRIDLEV